MVVVTGGSGTDGCVPGGVGGGSMIITVGPSDTGVLGTVSGTVGVCGVGSGTDSVVVVVGTVVVNCPDPAPVPPVVGGTKENKQYTITIVKALTSK